MQSLLMPVVLTRAVLATAPLSRPGALAEPASDPAAANAALQEVLVEQARANRWTLWGVRPTSEWF